MKFGMRKWMVVPALLAAVGCSSAQAQQQKETQPETRVTLRSDDGQVRIEIVDDKGEILQIVSKTITLLDLYGVEKGALLLDAYGAVTVETTPEPKPRVRIGLTTETIPEPLALHLAMNPSSGLMVTAVTEGLAAHKAGLAQYDLVVKLDDQSPVTQESLRERVERCQPGETITLTIVRQGNEQTIDIVAEPYGEYDFIAPYTYNYKPQDYTVLTDTRAKLIADAIVLDVTSHIVQPDAIALAIPHFVQPEQIVVQEATRGYAERILASLITDTEVVTHLEAIVTTDDCPIAALRAELQAMMKQIAAMEAIVDRIQTPRDE